MKSILYIFTLSILTLAQTNCYSQDSTIVRIGPNYSASSESAEYFIMLDGVPIFKTKTTLNYIDTTSIDSIIIHKQIIKNANGKQKYNAFIEIRSIESLNRGLKYIQKQSDYFIFEYPLANLSINGKKTKWINIFKNKQLISNPDIIQRIEIIEPNKVNRKYKNGLIELEIRKE